MTGRKFDKGKLDWTLMPWRALSEVVRVLEHGEHKYDRDNWQQVENGERRYTAAAFRHLIAAQSEDLDEESELLHLAHAATDLLFLIHLKLEHQNEPTRTEIPTPDNEYLGWDPFDKSRGTYAGNFREDD